MLVKKRRLIMASKRRANGEGSITKRADGRWMGRYKIFDNLGIRRSRVVYGKTKAEVASKLREALSMAELNQDINKPTETLGQFYHYWLKTIAPSDLKQTTINMYEGYFQKWILPSLGNKKLNKISTKDIQLMIYNMEEKTHAKRSCQICRNVLSTVLHCAVDQDTILANPARKVKVPKYDKKKKTILDDQELRKLLKVADSSSSYALVYKLLACCGLRIGEVLGLSKDAVSFENTKLQIKQQVVLLNNHPTISTPKTKASIRSVDFPIELCSELNNLISTLKNENDLLFRTKSGQPISPNNLRRDFRKVIERAQVKRISPHALRHMYCTRSLSDGASLKAVQENMGHSNPQVTIGVYQHATTKDREVIAKGMSSVLAY